MGMQNRRPLVSEDYLNLILRFPLRPIRSDAEYKQAGELLGELMVKSNDPGLSSGESDYADMLTQLVREWDEEHSSILAEAKDLPPLEILKFLMEEHGMSTTDLGKLLGSGKGQASLILNGKRELSKTKLRTLAKRFCVTPALFL